MISASKVAYYIFMPVALVLTGCNYPGVALNSAEATQTPYIIYVTATPQQSGDNGAAPTPTLPLIGPFGPTLEVTPHSLVTATQPEPTLDLNSITLTAGVVQTGIPVDEAVTETATPEGSVTPTASTEDQTAQASINESNSAPRFGIDFISSGEFSVPNERIALGISAGAGWDRFPIYWNQVELESGGRDWSRFDRAVRQDVENGLQTNGILLGVPTFEASPANVPVTLFEPVFSDGTDQPGTGKKINPDNGWANFVYDTVSRYRPGGTLAQNRRWRDGQGVRVWEVWNEPDFSLFWRGSVDEYARLVKVSFLAARLADPTAEIMIGGLVGFEQPGFLLQLLNIYKSDPNPIAETYPFTMVAVHSYSYSADVFRIVQRTQGLLAIYGLGDHPIWLNESGVAVWDDYPGPTWATRADQRVLRATEDEQASYVIQAASYAFMAGADVFFQFQLYDDCGNQPMGTTFAPHNGELCESTSACWGDALGLMRNGIENACFNQHPQPNTPRPAFAAYHTVADIFGKRDFVPFSASRGPNGDQVWLRFVRPSNRRMITVVWDESGSPGEAVIPAQSAEVVLVAWNGERTTIQPAEDGAFHVPLDAATNRNEPRLSGYMIGGKPVILLEDAGRPEVSVVPLLDRSRQAFLVRWQTTDVSLSTYEVWYRDDTEGGDWIRWLETATPGDALFVGGSGRRYSFFARGQLPDGSWTTDAPVVQASTVVE